ncbi:hypothetical protein Ddc_24903 [Ditylenchus destructor]|nr:hypothetical protein Ddc_24903 [Ditylenchus destructor]
MDGLLDELARARAHIEAPPLRAQGGQPGEVRRDHQRPVERARPGGRRRGRRQPGAALRLLRRAAVPRRRGAGHRAGGRGPHPADADPRRLAGRAGARRLRGGPRDADSSPVTARLQMLGERLRETCGARNWTAVARTDAELAPRCGGGLDTSQLSPGERGALQQLRRLHAQVRGDCERELERGCAKPWTDAAAAPGLVRLCGKPGLGHGGASMTMTTTPRAPGAATTAGRRRAEHRRGQARQREGRLGERQQHDRQRGNPRIGQDVREGRGPLSRAWGRRPTRPRPRGP